MNILGERIDGALHMIWIFLGGVIDWALGRSLPWKVRILACLLLCASPAFADSVVEVSFHDGSRVRMTLAQESIEVTTKYGSLVIPVADVRRIEFGLHLHPDARASMDAAAVALGAADFKARELASKDLMRHGHKALPALRLAARSTDKEVSRRAALALTQLETTVAPALFALQEQDRVHTTEFLVIGRITALELKVTSAIFGERSLSLSDLASLHADQQVSKDLSVDASSEKWLDTGVVIGPHTRLEATASGSVDLWPQQAGTCMTGAKGFNVMGKGGRFMAGALIGKVSDHPEFVVGEKALVSCNVDGNLFLRIEPSTWGVSSTGTYTVKLRPQNAR